MYDSVDRVLGVQNRRDLLGDRLQVVEADSAGLVHVEAHELPPARPLHLDVDELEAPVGRHPLRDGPDPLERPVLLRQSHTLQKKEWATPLW